MLETFFFSDDLQIQRFIMQTEKSGMDRGGEGWGEAGHTNLFQRLPTTTTTCDALKAQ